nr:hypothetical protein [Lachnospiraceae bacterium]
LAEDGKKATCPYCGHEMLIEKNDPAEREYEERMAKARAEEDILDLKTKRQRSRRFKGFLIALCVIAGLLFLNIFIPGSPINKFVFAQKADPFTILDVTFSGMSGDGKAQLQFSDRSEAAFANVVEYEIVPETGLFNGDAVTVKASASGWRFDPSEKQFTVKGLAEWVLQTEQLGDTNMSSVHENTERLVREDWKEILSSSYATDMTITPYKVYLFVSGSRDSHMRNVLYDTYEVKVTREDGSIYTNYEACRYSNLKIPADGVLTADYGNLMGFNLGFTQGFSYSHAFSGWSDASEMEAELRHACDGYRLAE